MRWPEHCCRARSVTATPWSSTGRSLATGSPSSQGSGPRSPDQGPAPVGSGEDDVDDHVVVVGPGASFDAVPSRPSGPRVCPAPTCPAGAPVPLRVSKVDLYDESAFTVAGPKSMPAGAAKVIWSPGAHGGRVRWRQAKELACCRRQDVGRCSLIAARCRYGRGRPPAASPIMGRQSSVERIERMRRPWRRAPGGAGRSSRSRCVGGSSAVGRAGGSSPRPLASSL